MSETDTNDASDASDANGASDAEEPIAKGMEDLEEHEKILARIVKGVKITGLLIVVAIAAFVLWKFVLCPYGKVVWLVEAGGKPGVNRFLASNKARIIVQFGSEFVALKPEDGAEIWRIDSERTDWTTVDFKSEGIFLFHQEEMQRIDSEGKQTVKVKLENPRRLLGYNDVAAVMLEGKMIPFRKHLKALIKAGLLKYDPDSEYDPFENADKMPPVWQNECLLAVAMDDGKELWRVPIGMGQEVGAQAMSDDVWVGCVTKAVRYQHSWKLVALKLGDGTLMFRRIIPRPVDQYSPDGLRIGDEEIAYSDYTCIYRVDFKGAELSKEEIKRDDDSDRRRQPRVREEIGALRFIGRGVVSIDPDTGKEQWKFELAGGITYYGVNTSTLFVTGHKTKEGGQSEDMDQVTNMLGLDGAGAAYVASAGAVADHTLLALERKTGKKLWEHDRYTGQIACDDNRMLVLQDTAQTSVVIRSRGGRGELVLHQFDPEAGKNIFSRTTDEFMLWAPRIIGEHLVALAFDRDQPKQEERDEEDLWMEIIVRGAQTPRSKCLGVVAIRVK